MKKKLNLLGVLVVSFLFCLVGVKAYNPEIIYQVYENGSEIIWDNSNNHRCDSLHSDCKKYIVSQEDNEQTSTITLTEQDSSEVIVLNKAQLVSAYIMVTTNELGDFYLAGEGKIGDGDSPYTDTVKKIIYYDTYANSYDIINNANTYADDGYYVNVVSSYMHLIEYDGTITVNKNVTVTAQSVWVKNIINNGKIKTGCISSEQVTGNGIINLVYSADNQGDPFIDADRLEVGSISGVKVNITGIEVKDGVQFGFLGFTDNAYGRGITKEEAQKIINQLNVVKGSGLDGYRVVMKEVEVFNPYGDEPLKAYIGVLEKEKETTVVANPKTSDSIINIIAIIVLAGAGTFFTIKKVKNN